RGPEREQRRRHYRFSGLDVSPPPRQVRRGEWPGFEAIMRVKLFWKNEPMKPATGFLGGGRSGRNAQGFEAEINTWLQQHPGIKVVHIKQSASGGSFADSLWLISVWYEQDAEPGDAPARQGT